ncbi:MAG: hypothetical protein LQ339_004127 [Xanthoria mediterranea]|nr:MAG: hypothetical protein LQ339_004127 [Xanthoria mediterranea]
MPQTPISEGLRTGQMDWLPPVPLIEDDQPFSEVVRELSQYFVDAIEVPHTFEQLRTASVGNILRPLVGSLSDRCHHPGIVSALMVVKSLFSNVEHDDRGVFQTRGFACEIVAWRFLAHLSEHERIDYLLTELPPVVPSTDDSSETEEVLTRPMSEPMDSSDGAHERVRLLVEDRTMPKIHEPRRQRTWNSRMSDSVDDDPTMAFAGLNALEIATLASAKRFLSQHVVQRIIDGIWEGDIIFWESLSVETTKRAQIYHQRYQ